MRWSKVALITAFAVLVATSVSAEVQYHIRVNGREIRPDPPPQNIEGRLFVPLRAVSEALGAQVDYDADTNTASITLATSAVDGAKLETLKKQLAQKDARITELTKLADTQAAISSAPIRDSLPGVKLQSAYLSIKIDVLKGANLDALTSDMLAGTLDRYDGIHIIAQDALVTIHGPDIQSWKAGNLTGTEFLNRWQISGGTGAPVPPVTITPVTEDVIESNIDGTFEGWTGDTIFKLANGQIWLQSSYAYTYHYAYMPKVLIYRSGAIWKMKVDGVSDEITVKRLK